MKFKLPLFSALVSLFFIYSLFVYTGGTEISPGAENAGPLAVNGKLLWQKHNCISCHQLYGLGGYIGPDLTTVIEKKGEAYAKAFILNGTQRMPNFHLTEEEARSLVEYLAYVNSTAVTYQLSSH